MRNSTPSTAPKPALTSRNKSPTPKPRRSAADDRLARQGQHDTFAARISAAVDAAVADEHTLDARILALTGLEVDATSAQPFEHRQREFGDLTLEVGSASDEV